MREPNATEIIQTVNCLYGYEAFYIDELDQTDEGVVESISFCRDDRAIFEGKKSFTSSDARQLSRPTRHEVNEMIKEAAKSGKRKLHLKLFPYPNGVYEDLERDGFRVCRTTDKGIAGLMIEW